MLEPRERRALCIWEYFYLARPDTGSRESRCTARACGWASGSPQEAPAEADLVLPIPDSGIPAAIGFARALGLPFSEGLIKNRYVQRTFIQPGQELRKQGIRLKYHPVAEVAGKRVVAVDDSIVRGNTTEQIVRMLFDAGATEVHVRVSSPPVVGQCFYGIDLADPSEMIAAGRTIEEVRERDRRDVARVPLPRRPRRGDAAAGVGALPRLPDGRLPDRDSRRGSEAPLRTRALLAAGALRLELAAWSSRMPIGVGALLGVLAPELSCQLRRFFFFAIVVNVAEDAVKLVRARLTGDWRESSATAQRLTAGSRTSRSCAVTDQRRAARARSGSPRGRSPSRSARSRAPSAPRRRRPRRAAGASIASRSSTR